MSFARARRKAISVGGMTRAAVLSASDQLVIRGESGGMVPTAFATGV